MLYLTNKLSAAVLACLLAAAAGLQVLPDPKNSSANLVEAAQLAQSDWPMRFPRRSSGDDKRAVKSVKPQSKLLGEKRAPVSSYNVAWLISGQVSRFIYKDGTSMLDGGLKGFLGCEKAGLKSDSCQVGVHIALSNTHVKQFFGPKPILPTYGSDAYKEQRLENHYSSLAKDNFSQVDREVWALKANFLTAGASHVKVRILSNDEFDEDIKQVRARIVKRAEEIAPSWSKPRWAHWWERMPRHEQRFETNGNMMYLRHLAYASAAEYEKTQPWKYTHILYTREDNVFVHPSYSLIQMAKKMDGDLAPGAGETAIYVDKFCGWLSYSDKIYFANRPGIEVLIKRTLDDHITRLASWINRGLGWTNRDPLQTEVCFKEWLDEAKAKVIRWDFERTEARYAVNTSDPKSDPENPKICIPQLYNKCTDKHVFPECP